MSKVDEPQEMEALRRDAWTFVLRMTSGAATKADLADLKRWCAQSSQHAEALAHASRRWHAFGPALEGAARQNPQALARLAKPAGMGRRAFLGGAAAAMAAGTAFAVVRPPLGLWPSITELAADYRTAPGEQRQIALADNIFIEMNTRTSLNIRARQSDNNQIELISGEAAISTQRKRVEVIAGNSRIAADAARFSIRCEGSQLNVVCLDGRVEVEQPGPLLILQQNQQVTYAAGRAGPVTTVEAALATGWRDGDLYFRDEPLARVIEEVNRYRSSRIVLMNDALAHRRFTARFKLDRLDIVVAQLQATFGARVTQLPGGFVVIS